MQEGISVNERQETNFTRMKRERNIHADDDDKSVKLNIESGMNV